MNFTADLKIYTNIITRKREGFNYHFGGAAMFFYIPIEEHLSTTELGSYRSYGIRVENEVGDAIMILSDISTDQEKVAELAERCTSGALAPEHLRDVVLDCL